MTMDHTEQFLEFDPANFVRSFYEIAKRVFLAPKLFFASVQKTGGLRNPAIFMGACVLVHTFFVAVGVRSPEIVVKNFLLGIVFPFLTAGVLFFFITKLFKITGTYEMAFRVNAYAAAISLVSWIPGIGLLLEAYRLYLLTVGLSLVFDMRVSRAFVVIVLTLAVFVVASGALVHVTGGTLFQLGS